jgi:hypothetical protein
MGTSPIIRTTWTREADRSDPSWHEMMVDFLNVVFPRVLNP